MGLQIIRHMIVSFMAIAGLDQSPMPQMLCRRKVLCILFGQVLPTLLQCSEVVVVRGTRPLLDRSHRIGFADHKLPVAIRAKGWDRPEDLPIPKHEYGAWFHGDIFLIFSTNL